MKSKFKFVRVVEDEFGCDVRLAQVVVRRSGAHRHQETSEVRLCLDDRPDGIGVRKEYMVEVSPVEG